MADCDVVQIGNEPDVPETFMTPEEYAEQWVLYRNTYPDFTMFSAGLASGQLAYCEQVLVAIGDQAPLPDAIAIHPYIKTPDEAASLFDAYWNLTVELFGAGIPIVATEWYRPAARIRSGHFRICLPIPKRDGPRSGARGSASQMAWFRGLGWWTPREPPKQKGMSWFQLLTVTCCRSSPELGGRAAPAKPQSTA